VSRLAGSTPNNYFLFAASTGQSYAFSFCNNIYGAKCPGRSAVSSSMTLKPKEAGCQQSFGAVGNTTAKLLATDPSAGVSVTYQGGQPCADGSPSYSTYNLLCDPTVAAGSVNVTNLVVIQQNCAVEFNVRTAAACPYPKTRVVTPLGAGYIALIAVVASLSLYCAVGAGVKRYRQGSSGIESVPHIDTLRALYAGATRAVHRLRGGAASDGADYLAAPGGGDEEESWPAR